MASVVYNTFFERQAKNSMGSLESDQIKVALMSVGYVASKNNQAWASISGYEATGTNYTANGLTLGGVSITKSDANAWVYMDATNSNWANVTITATGCVVYDDTHASDALICFLSFGTSKEATAASLTLQWSTGGIVRWYQG